MDTRSLLRWRNLGVIAHVDAGKTTLTERLLWKTGAIHRMGEVHDGATTTDFQAIERARGITIGAAAVQTHWTPNGEPDHRLTLIDTPGHIDFAIEVERSLRVLDGAVVVFSAVDGVQPQSETVWRQARRHGVPLIAFANKMDRIGATFDTVLEQMRDKLGANPWAIGVPIGSESSFDGWVDLIGRTVEHWEDGGAAVRRPWNADDDAAYAAQRQQLIAAVAEHDDALASAYIEEREIDDALLRSAVRRATLAGKGVPVLAGAAFKTKGIEPLLDAIVHYLPSPLDRPPVIAESDRGDVELAPDPSGPLAGLVFKIAHHDHGPLAFVRLYSGTLKAGDAVWCSLGQRTRRVSRLAVVQANRTHDVEQAYAGEIVAILGWKDAVSGETLSDAAHPLVLESIQAQPAVLSWRLTAHKASDLIRLGQGLASLVQEDPSFRVDTDSETGETLVWGMGELHLDVMVERLRTEWNVDVRTGSPRVAYQETPRREVHKVEGKVSKQTGGHGQFARVVIDITPRDDGVVEFVNRTTGGVVPGQFIAATEKGVRSALTDGPHGYPVVGITVALVDGETHAVDSSDMAFQRAASEAVTSALERVGTVVLEPVMDVAVDTPAAHVGDVVGDLQRRAGRVVRIDDKGGRADVIALAPLSRLQGYTTTLRSLTQGRASASVTFNGYEAATPP
ncbi:elongation factor G [Montanilutibacter psychrotolerans]|uniref:Elongation factor G n=1 Tax=Montanilutibacter psychrotolerans TaxID=1327343 RepID=A0A3M8T546_9GAMM|nr:elongation factor G [Lysobacter psychrotolerans]RNF86320.1 elongation factor G [Lysobacter psychrotolerans]